MELKHLCKSLSTPHFHLVCHFFFLNTVRMLKFVRECYDCSGEKGHKIHLVKFSEGTSSTAKCRLHLKVTCNYLIHPSLISSSGQTCGNGSHFDSKSERHTRGKHRWRGEPFLGLLTHSNFKTSAKRMSKLSGSEKKTLIDYLKV